MKAWTPLKPLDREAKMVREIPANSQDLNDPPSDSATLIPLTRILPHRRDDLEARRAGSNGSQYEVSIHIQNLGAPGSAKIYLVWGDIPLPPAGVLPTLWVAGGDKKEFAMSGAAFPFHVIIEPATVSAEALGSPAPGAFTYGPIALANTPLPGGVVVQDAISGETWTDNGQGVLVASGGSALDGTIDYGTGDVTINWGGGGSGGNAITADYSYDDGSTQDCRVDRFVRSSRA